MIRKLSLVFVFALMSALLFAVSPAKAAMGGGVVSITRCEPGPVLQVDPIVNPGGEQSEHMHQFFGGEGIQPVGTVTTVQDMQMSESTCPLTSDTAGYWVPTLHQADGTEIAPTFMNVYYRSPRGKTVQAPLLGDGFVCGSEPRPGCAVSSSQGGGGWGCADSDSHSTIAEALPCGNHLIAHVQINPTDTSLPKVTLHVRYQLTSCDGCYISSDMGAPGGSTLHGDWFQTWDMDVFNRLIATLNAGRSCTQMTDAKLSCLSA
jgi:Domain of unknown function (DUF1996)